MRDLRYVQNLCQRDLTSSTSFASGVQIFKWDVPVGERWIPSRSYMRFPTTLTKANGTQLDVSDGLAFSVNPIANCYERVELRLNSIPLQYYDSNYTGVCDTVIKRQQKSQSAIAGTLKDAEMFDYNLDNRINRLAADGVLSQIVKTGYADLGFAGATTIALSAGGVLTFSGGPASAPTTVAGVFSAGDQIVLSVGGATISTYTIAAVSLLTVTLNVGGAASYTAFGATALSTNPVWRLRTESSERITSKDLTWEPTDLFSDPNLTLPPGTWELWCYPKSTYKTAIVESKTAKTAGVDYAVTISNVFLYVCQVRMASPKAAEEIVMETVNVRVNALPASTARNQILVNVPPSTHAITVGFQDQAAGYDTTKSSSLLKLASHGEKQLNRFNIQYKSMNSNVPELDPEYTGGGADYRNQMWRQCKQNDGSYFFTGGCEDFASWGGPNEESSGFGMYYYHKFYAPPNDRSIEATVTTQFGTAPSNANQILMAHYLRKATIKMENGRAAGVMVEDYFEDN